MAVLSPGSKEIIVGKSGDFRFVSGRGMMRQDDEYSPPQKRLKRSLMDMAEGVHWEMKAFLYANEGVLGGADQIALELIRDEKRRLAIAQEMEVLIPRWGGYIPVLDCRTGDETLMAVIGEDKTGDLTYYILAKNFDGVSLAWFELKELWPMVVYECWVRHQSSRTSGQGLVRRRNWQRRRTSSVI